MGLFDFAVEHLIPEQQAVEITRPYWSELSEVWVSSWREWDSVSEEHRAMLSQTPFVPPVALFGFAQYFARQTFDGRETDGIVRCTELCGVVGYYIGEKVLVRFNSVDSDGIVRNSQGGSDRKDQYFRQEPIPGINIGATRLTVGSIANPTKSGLGSVVISCQVGDELYYSFPIDGTDQSQLAVPTPTIAPAPPAVSQQLRKANPR